MMMMKNAENIEDIEDEDEYDEDEDEGDDEGCLVNYTLLSSTLKTTGGGEVSSA